MVRAMIKALFFDIDGTLVSFDTHEIPLSTVHALSEAKLHGIRIFISTGRPKHFITNLNAIENLIDGYVTTNGALSTIGNKTIRITAVHPDDLNEILRFVETFCSPCILMGLAGIGILNRNEMFDDVICNMLKIDCSTYEKPIDELLRAPVLQITPFFSIEEERQAMLNAPNCTAVRWIEHFCDITSTEADKGKGLAAIAQAEGIDISETMAFGDGGNDIAIIQRAGIGVAMGNASDEVKTAADYVTTNIDNDGVRNALLHFGII